ncbi:hypothetical protein ACPPVT_16880 [Angustibacter sp. McL0619]|uniref:hypothetical protein n=1 Tax=Angustibacter sp. McL0619 TaxID=3415676 RepID=UPI003CFAF7E4
MSTVLTLLVLTAFVALVLRQLENNAKRSRGGVDAAPGTAQLDRDAQRVAADLTAEASTRLSGRRAHSSSRRQQVGRHVARPA